jgi:hypothetical protein
MGYVDQPVRPTNSKQTTGGKTMAAEEIKLYTTPT